MSYFLLGLALLVGLLLAQQWISTANTSLLKRRIGVALGILLLAVSAGLFFRGAAAPASGLAMLGLWLMSSFGGGGMGGLGRATKSSGQTSTLGTEYLEIALDHDSGEIRGEVRKGRFAGRALETLSPADLADLWEECRHHDPQSAQVVEAFLDQVYPDWRDQAGTGQSRGGQASGWPGADAASMTREEALDILGLTPGATDDEIREAHKQLMLKLHPDKGGSTYFASKINQAKDVLLG